MRVEPIWLCALGGDENGIAGLRLGVVGDVRRRGRRRVTVGRRCGGGGGGVIDLDRFSAVARSGNQGEYGENRQHPPEACSFSSFHVLFLSFRVQNVGGVTAPTMRAG